MTNRSRAVLAVLGALSMAPAGAQAAEPPPAVPAIPPPVLAPADKVTLQKLHDGDQANIQLGSLAERRGSRAVRDLGRRIADDCTVSDRKIDQYMRTRGTDITALVTTTSVDPDRELLATKVGPDFDRAFTQRVVRDLQATLDLLGSERVATADDNLRLLYDDLASALSADKEAAEDVLAGMARS